MASDDQFKSMNDLFKETYAESLREAYDRKYGTNYAEMSIETLEYRVNRYEDEGAKKELKKRSTPLWKVLND